MSEGLSCRLKLRRIEPSGSTIDLRATPEECLSLAERLDLPAIAWLEGKFHLQPTPGGIVLATLDLIAEVTRISVVSLEPFPASLRESARLRFVPAEAEEDDDLLDPEAPDDIPYTGETLDLGAALAEQLALALDPYPRRLDETLSAPAAEPRSETAFAALTRLRGPADRK